MRCSNYCITIARRAWGRRDGGGLHAVIVSSKRNFAREDYMSAEAIDSGAYQRCPAGIRRGSSPPIFGVDRSIEHRNGASPLPAPGTGTADIESRMLTLTWRQPGSRPTGLSEIHHRAARYPPHPETELTPFNTRELTCALSKKSTRRSCAPANSGGAKANATTAAPSPTPASPKPAAQPPDRRQKPPPRQSAQSPCPCQQH